MRGFYIINQIRLPNVLVASEHTNLLGKLQKNIKNLRKSIKSISKELKVSNDSIGRIVYDYLRYKSYVMQTGPFRFAKTNVYSLIRSNSLLRQVEI